MEFYRQTIAKLISGLEPGDHAGRQAIYDRMRVTNEGYIEKNRDRLSDPQAQSMRAQLDDAIDQTESAFSVIPVESPADDPLHHYEISDGLEMPHGIRDPLTMGEVPTREAVEPEASRESALPPPAVTRSPSPSAPAFWRERRFLAGFGGGLVIGCVLAFGAMSYRSVAGATTGAESNPLQAAFEADFQGSRETAEKLIEIIERIEVALLERQQADGAAVAQASAGKFKNLAEILPEFSDVGQEVGVRRLDIRVRASESDHKILLNSPICATIRYLRPDLLDTRRLDKGIGCLYFGVWSEGGAKF